DRTGRLVLVEHPRQLGELVVVHGDEPSGAVQPDDVRGTFEGAEHDGDAAVLTQVRDGLSAAGGEVEVGEGVLVDDRERSVQALRRDVDMPIVTARGGGDEEDPLSLDELTKATVDPLVHL